MLEQVSVLPCSRALTGPFGFHVRGASFVRRIESPRQVKEIDFIVCMRVEDEPPPEVKVEVYDPWTLSVFHSVGARDLEQVSPFYEVCVRVPGVILQETGEHAFKLFLNGEAAYVGPLWGLRL